MTQKQVIEQIEKIIEQNSITGFDFEQILSQVRAADKRVVFFGQINNQKVTVKFCVDKIPKEIKNILNEMSVLNCLSENKYDFQSKIFAYDTGRHPWLIKSYLGGKPAGALLDFKKAFIDHIPPDKIISTIKKFKKLKPKLIWNYKVLSNAYSKNLDFIDQYISEQFKGRGNWSKYFVQSIMPLSSKKYLSHNDLNAGNVLFDINGNFRIIDWENAGFDTFQKDFANIFHMAYNFPEWQSKFINEMNFTKSERLEFNAWAIYLLLYNSAGLRKLKIKKEKIYYRSGELTDDKIDKYLSRSLFRINDLSKYFIQL